MTIKLIGGFGVLGFTKITEYSYVPTSSSRFDFLLWSFFLSYNQNLIAFDPCSLESTNKAGYIFFGVFKAYLSEKPLNDLFVKK